MWLWCLGRLLRRSWRTQNRWCIRQDWASGCPYAMYGSWQMAMLTNGAPCPYHLPGERVFNFDPWLANPALSSDFMIKFLGDKWIAEVPPVPEPSPQQNSWSLFLEQLVVFLPTKTSNCYLLATILTCSCHASYSFIMLYEDDLSMTSYSLGSAWTSGYPFTSSTSLGSYMTGCWNHRLFWWTIQICHTPEGCTNMNSIMTNLSWMFPVNHPGCTRGASRVITALLREVHFCQRDVCFHHSVVCWWTIILYKRFWNFFVISFAFGVFPTLACGTCLSWLLAGSWL
jgi:hypothetical protein